MASASEEPYEAAEEADHEHDLEEQPKKKKRINEVRDWIKGNPFFFSASFSTFSASYMEISARLYQNLR